MSHDRHGPAAGSCHFFTLATHHRRPVLSLGDGLFILRRALADVMSQRPFTLDALVVLPDHLHCIWTLPDGDTDCAGRWGAIKSKFSCQYRRTGRMPQRQLWEPHFQARRLRGEADYWKHVDYIHLDPVKHGYVQAPMDWLPSSFPQFVDRGWYTATWGSRNPAPAPVTTAKDERRS